MVHFSTKSHIVGIHYNHLAESILNEYPHIFYGELKEIVL